MSFFDFQPHLKDEQVSIEPLNAGHRDELYAVASDPLLWEQHPAKERATPEGFATFFQESIDSGGAVLIRDAVTGEAIGSSRYWALGDATDKIEIGWTYIARKYWGGRYNAAIKKLMFDHSFAYVPMVVLIIDETNYRSLYGNQKMGGRLMTREELGIETKETNHCLVFERHRWKS